MVATGAVLVEGSGPEAPGIAAVTEAMRVLPPTAITRPPLSPARRAGPLMGPPLSFFVGMGKTSCRYGR